MADVATALQRAIYNALTSDAFREAAGLDIPVYDRVPGGAQPPYIKIGDDDILPDLAQGYDGREATCTIVTWAPGPGKTVLKPIVAAIEATLAPIQNFQPPQAPPLDLSADGQRVVTWSLQGSRYSDDLDGVSVKAATVIAYDTQPT